VTNVMLWWQVGDLIRCRALHLGAENPVVAEFRRLGAFLTRSPALVAPLRPIRSPTTVQHDRG